MRHNNNKIEIGEKLKNARLSCGLTQEQACEKIHCAPRYIGQLETNNTIGSISLILELCNLYSITLNDLYADYLDIESTTNDLSHIIGYFKLNSYNRSIIENNIAFLNKLQNNEN